MNSWPHRLPINSLSALTDRISSKFQSNLVLYIIMSRTPAHFTNNKDFYKFGRLQKLSIEDGGSIYTFISSCPFCEITDTSQMNKIIIASMAYTIKPQLRWSLNKYMFRKERMVINISTTAFHFCFLSYLYPCRIKIYSIHSQNIKNNRAEHAFCHFINICF